MDIMHDHITDLLNAGYKVAIEPDLIAAKGLGPRRYWAHVEMDGDGEGPMTAEGASPAEAIWAASPLHHDNEPMPPLAVLIAETSDDLKDVLGEVRAALPTPGMRDELRTLSAEMSDVFDRLDVLEDGKRGPGETADPGACHRHPAERYGTCPTCNADIDAAIARDKANGSGQ